LSGGWFTGDHFGGEDRHLCIDGSLIRLRNLLALLTIGEAEVIIL